MMSSMQLLPDIEAVTIDYSQLEDEALRAKCERGWLRLTDLKCCRLVTTGLSWQVSRTKLDLQRVLRSVRILH